DRGPALAGLRVQDEHEPRHEDEQDEPEEPYAQAHEAWRPRFGRGGHYDPSPGAARYAGRASLDSAAGASVSVGKISTTVSKWAIARISWTVGWTLATAMRTARACSAFAATRSTRRPTLPMYVTPRMSTTRPAFAPADGFVRGMRIRSNSA